MAEHLDQVIGRRGDVGTAARGLEAEEISNEPQCVTTAFSRGYDVLDAVSEHQGADAIVVADSRHREHGGQLGCELALEPAACAESLGSGDIDSQHDRELALLDVAFHVRTLHAGCDVPIDAAHLVAGLILPHLGELHPLSLEDGAILAAEQRVNESARAQLEQLDLLQHFRWNGRGARGGMRGAGSGKRERGRGKRGARGGPRARGSATRIRGLAVDVAPP